jgi:chromosome segregation ATPase
MASDIQKKSYAYEFQRESDRVMKQCENNRISGEGTLLPPRYEAVDLQKDLWDVLDNVSTLLQLFDDMISRQKEKRDAETDKLNEYRQKRDDLKRQAQNNITRLEDVEKQLNELAIDFKIVAGEFEHSLKAISSKAQYVGSRTEAISKKDRDSWIYQLQVHLSQSNQELGNIKKLESTDKHYLEYNRHLQKHIDLVSEIRGNISQINSLITEVEGSLK